MLEFLLEIALRLADLVIHSVEQPRGLPRVVRFHAPPAFFETGNRLRERHQSLHIVELVVAKVE